MGYLLDYGLVEKIGPVENSGLYEITERGQLVVQYQKKCHDEDIGFDDFIESKLAEFAEE